MGNNVTVNDDSYINSRSPRSELKIEPIKLISGETAFPIIKYYYDELGNIIRKHEFCWTLLDDEQKIEFKNKIDELILMMNVDK